MKQGNKNQNPGNEEPSPSIQDIIDVSNNLCSLFTF